MNKVVEDIDFTAASNFFENPDNMLDGGAVEVITKDNVYFNAAPIDDAIALREIYQKIIPGFTDFNDYDASLDEAVEYNNIVILLIDGKAHIFAPTEENEYQSKKIEEFNDKMGALKNAPIILGSNGNNIKK